MDFSWSPQQSEFFDAVGRLAEPALNDNLIERNRNGVFNRDGWKKCGEFGIQGLAVPADYGGKGLDPLTSVGALERLGYACRDNGLLFALNAHMWAVCMPLAAFGTEQQKRRYLPGLCNGDLIGGHAMSEPESGSDAYSIRATATRKGDKYILNGKKIFVTNGPVADLIVVFATVDRSKGAAGITGFLVDRSSPGFAVTREVEKMGLRTALMGELLFEGCEIPASHRLGDEGVGANLFTHSMAWERGCILASAVGSMQRLLEKCIRYAKRRRQFGQPIGKFQLVGGKIVDMKARVETSRYLLYHGAFLRGLGRSAMLEAALAKMHISECWVRCCEDAIQIHGGHGYLTENEIERELRDAIASRIFSGTNEVQRSLIASLLI